MQDLISLIIVAMAAAYVGRGILRTITGKSCGCASATCGRRVVPPASKNDPRSLLRLPVLPR